MNISRAVGIVLVSGTALVFFEWLFFVTKPSFMSLFTTWEKISVLSSTAAIVSVALLTITLPFLLAGRLFLTFSPWRTPPLLLAFLPVILVLTVTMLLLIDNFSLTLFGFGIRDTSGWTVHIYRLGSLVLFLLSARWLLGILEESHSSSTTKVLPAISGIIVAASIPLLLLSYDAPGTESLDLPEIETDLPNIIILSGDGIAAEHMSLYGYGRETTPFLDSVRDEFLIAENHFTNAGDTGGSVISLLSGKLPTTTKVIYPPDVLIGGDSYQHLPGLLKRFGYYTADVSVRHYADPYDLNMRNGFEEANLRKLKDTGGPLIAAIRRIQILNPASMLLDRMYERTTERLNHIWKNIRMPDPKAEVNVPRERWMTDDDRMAEIERLITSAPNPLFLNVHMMGTHGSLFNPSVRIWSTEENSKTPWDIDGYDDAILDFDRRVEQIYGWMREAGTLNSTIFIVSSDHGFRHASLERLPMLLRLPGKSSTGYMDGNTQRLDIAPTLLEILGVNVPEWMEGRSMLRVISDEDAYRPIFSSLSHMNKSVDGDIWQVKTPTAPWYSLGRLYLVYCDQGFILHLGSMEIESREVPGSTILCENKLALDEALALMLEHLKMQGYVWN